MQAGELRTPIRLQYSKQTIVDDFKSIEWIDFGNLSSDDQPKYTKCKWVPLGGSETWAAKSAQVTDGANVTIRYNPSVTSQFRLIKDEIVYSIISPNDPDQHRQWLVFKASAAVNSG